MSLSALFGVISLRPKHVKKCFLKDSSVKITRTYYSFCCRLLLLLLLLLYHSAVTEARVLGVPCKCSRKSNFQCWFSSYPTLKYYIRVKNLYFCRYKKVKSDTHYSYFAFFVKLVKVTITSDRQQLLKSADDSLKTHPHHFWKYFSNFIQLIVDNQFVTDSKLIFDASCNHQN
jgi:hypothetical protein